MAIYGGIEAGGTKFVCMIGSGPEDILVEIRFPTTTPYETLAKTIAFFREHTDLGRLSSIGIACFGPVDLNPVSNKFGYITSTPKSGWHDTDILGILTQNLQVPMFMDTDVNGAAIGEGVWGAGQGLTDFVYFTIGTGIGGGGISNGKPIHGLVHEEMGHLRIPHNIKMDPFEGSCPYHGDCFEGLATGPAIRNRWGQPAEALPKDHPAWELEAHYIALALHNIVCVLSPQRIILGGGVMQQYQLFPLIRKKMQNSLNGYIQSEILLHQIDSYIVPPGLGNQAGVLGALAIGQIGVSDME